jgi:hypothetical protein
MVGFTAFFICVFILTFLEIMLDKKVKHCKENA